MPLGLFFAPVMSGDTARGTLQDVRFRAVGVGLEIRWPCMGCGKKRAWLGSKGAGIRKRCGVCVAARVTQKAMADARLSLD